MLVDTHAHLDDEQFDSNRSEILDRAAAGGVEQIICIGTTADSSRRGVDLAVATPGVFAAVGIQPNYVSEAVEEDWDRIVELARLPQVVAIGETGLDHFWEYAGLDVQEDFFIRHVRLSAERRLPFVVHMREPRGSEDGGEEASTACAEHILRVLSEMAAGATLSGVMHSYTGNSALADSFVDLGLYISFAGMVTFKKSQGLRDVARQVPLERLLVETDAPYLSPHPVRGQRPNEPANIKHTAACLADVFGMELAEFAETTSRNARRLFALENQSILNRVE